MSVKNTINKERKTKMQVKLDSSILSPSFKKSTSVYYEADHKPLTLNFGELVHVKPRHYIKRGQGTKLEALV